jgi:hypothetical protein
MKHVPPQRPIPTLCFTSARWIPGIWHLPKVHGFDDHLRKLRTFVPLTEVDLGAGTLPFVALRSATIQAVVPRASEEELQLAPAGPGAGPRAVSCYLEGLAVHGTVEIHPAVRTSDFLLLQEGFLALRRCRVVPQPPGMPDPVPVVFVNARGVVAVTEEAQPGGQGALEQLAQPARADAPAQDEEELRGGDRVGERVV